MSRKPVYEIRIADREAVINKTQEKEFIKHLKVALLKVLLKEEYISYWQYEESVMKLKKEDIK